MTRKSIADHVELELGISMKELGAQFEISDHSTTPGIGETKVLESLWRLETLRNYGKSAEEMIEILGPRIVAGFSTTANDPTHDKYRQAQLLREILRAGLEKSLSKSQPSIKEALVTHFETAYQSASAPEKQFQFMTDAHKFDKKYPKKEANIEAATAVNQAKKGLRAISAILPNNRCRTVFAEVAAHAMAVSLNSYTGQNISFEIDAVPKKRNRDEARQKRESKRARRG